MNLGIDWGGFNNALARIDVPGSFQRGLDEGRARKQASDLRTALAAHAANPGNPEALRVIAAINPQMAAGLEDQAYQRQERQRAGEFRSAFGDYVAARPQPNALGSLVTGPAIPVRPTDDKYQEPTMGPPPEFSVAVKRGAPTQNALAPSQPVAFAVPAGPDPRIAARERALRADPEKFLTYEGKRLDIDADRLKQLRALNESAMQILGGVHDDATMQAGKVRARAMYQQFGVPTDFIDQIPDAYSPELVRSFQMQGMDTAKQLAAVARENKLGWDVEDDLLDNERADRNTDSQIETREGQLALGQDRNAIARERNDLTRTDPRRVAPQRRPDPQPSPSSVIGRIMAKQAAGQTLTPAEQRTLDEHRAPRGRGGRGRGRGGAAPARIVNQQTGQVMILKGGKWVPES